MSIIDTNEVSQVIRDVAAMVITPRYKNLREDEISTKSSATDYATAADNDAEDELARILPDMYPGAVVVGEESIARGIKSIDLLSQKEGILFVVDPVDGTKNFVEGNDRFCTMVACIVDGELTHSWIYDVVNDVMMTADKDNGVHFDGEVVEPLTRKPSLVDANGFASKKYIPVEAHDKVDDLEDQVASIKTLGCSGHEYLELIRGNRDFIIAGQTHPWDHLPGSLALSLLGGEISRWDGGEYQNDDEGVGIVSAVSPELRQALAENFTKDMQQAFEQGAAASPEAKAKQFRL